MLEGDASPDQVKISILAVIVLYNKALSDSPSLSSLQMAASSLSEKEARVKILVYDNTPGGQHPGTLPKNVEYHCGSGNGGLATPYNLGLAMAAKEGFDWLLTLDHDTVLPASFLRRVGNAARTLSMRSDIAGILPEIVDGDILISPQVLYCGRRKRVPANFVGIPKQEVVAINSGTAWNVRSLQEIGGFNTLFWLDYLDFWACHAIQRQNKRFYILGDIQVDHELSLNDRDHRMSPARFENYLKAQSAFFDLYKGFGDRFVLTFRLFATFSAQLLRRENIELRRLSWKYFTRRVFDSRTKRIATWKKEMTERLVIPN